MPWIWLAFVNLYIPLGLEIGIVFIMCCAHVMLSPVDDALITMLFIKVAF